MRLGKLDTRGRIVVRLVLLALVIGVAFVIAGSARLSRSANNRSAAPAGAIPLSAAPIKPEASAVINMADLAAAEQAARQAGAEVPPVRVLLFPELEDPAEPTGPAAPAAPSLQANPFSALGPQGALLASPPATQDYMGLDDIPMVDSSYIVIPPDVAGGVGPTRVMETFNNNFRVRDKATGATLTTVGTATFWAPVTLGNERNGLTDPRCTYDPYSCRWLVCMQTTTTNAAVLVGVSQTSDPAGAWFLYRYTGLSGSAGGNYLLDYPILGFNKNWIAVTINRFTSPAGAFSYGICLALDYPQAKVGVGTGSLFTLSGGAGSTHFCASPAWTYSPTEDTLFVVTHLGSAGATYVEETITGTPGAPVYTLAGVANVRPGGGWVQPSGNIEPQSAPNAGVSACGATPCKIEVADAQVRQSPVYRNGYVWYAQTIGLPAGALTHTAAQWTKLTPGVTPTAVFADGGRLDDPTATAINGGKWYDHVSLSVNSTNDMILGFTQFSSAQHPSAGYAWRYGTDAPGTIRDAFIYHAGEDYYHKTFTTATGRNRWGDFTTCQVDPCDDQTLWTLQEYAKTRTGTDDGNTGSNSSKWSSWWARVAGAARVAGLTCPPDTIGTAGGTVTRKFRITNNGTLSDKFSYNITDVAGWGGPASGTTPVLAPASFFDVFFTVTLPGNCSPVSDLITLSVTPVGCTGCFAPVTCTTTVYCDIATATLVGRFDAAAGTSGGVELVWSSDATGEIRSWNLYRSASADAGFLRINSDPIPMAGGGEFRFTDTGAAAGSPYYRLGAVMTDGVERVMQTLRYAAGGASRTLEFRIAGTNPFRSSTTLHYSLPTSMAVRIDVYTISGQRAATLVNRTEEAGVHSVPFLLNDRGHKLGAGVYLVRLRAGNETRTLRAIALQ